MSPLVYRNSQQNPSRCSVSGKRAIKAEGNVLVSMARESWRTGTKIETEEGELSKISSPFL